MTVSEMLDILEGRIARLGAERARLAIALQDAEQRLKAIADTASAPPEHGVTPAPRRRAAPKTPAPDPAAPPHAPEAASPPPATEPPAHTRGKRVALGRGLAQLRSRAPAPP
jgi:hypothetical protein